MAHAHSSSKSNKTNVNINAGGGGDNEVKPTTFHDFLGNKGQSQESAPAAGSGGRPPPEVSPSATSDLGSERHIVNHLEGIPFYGSRGPESSNRFSGNKRSNSDSFMLSSRDKFPDSQDSPLLTKLLRYSGGERHRRSHDEEASLGVHQMRPVSASFISQSSTGGRTGPSPMLQYPPRTGQVMPFGYQSQSNRFKDTNVGASLVSQTAADEGSRTGIKGSGILNATGTFGRQPAGVLIRSGKQKPAVSMSEPAEASTTPSQRGTEAGVRQMTIFYGGQAHVFDNVHPNKADVIMALAGSNGGSWSTTYIPNSSGKPSPGENRIPTADKDAISRELHSKASDKGESQRGFGTSD